jgi:hypothetical protein
MFNPHKFCIFHFFPNIIADSLILEGEINCVVTASVLDDF